MGSGYGYKRAMWNNRNVLCLDYINVIILVVRLHYSFSRCYHWGKLNREYYVILGFPSGSPVKNTTARQELQEMQVHLWVGTIPWRRAWQPTPVFLPGESYGQEEPGRLQSKGSQRVRNDWSKSACMHGIFLYFFSQLQVNLQLPQNGGSVVKNLPDNAGDLGLIPGCIRSPGEGTGNPLQYSCLGSPKDRGAWWGTVYGVSKSQKWLSD